MSPKHCVATVWINDISRKQAVANAMLIATAPEMLAVLREAEAVLTIVPPRSNRKQYLACLDRIRTVIAKTVTRP